MTVSIKRYRNSIKAFEAHIGLHFGHRVELHGHEPRYNPMAWADGLPSDSKGLVDDLLLVFEDRSEVTGTKEHGRFTVYNQYDSIAFAFNPEGDGDLTVRFSIRQGDTTRYSNPYPGETFRQAINAINRCFQAQGVPEDRGSMITLLEWSFMNNPELGIKPQDAEADMDDLLGEDRQIVTHLTETLNGHTQDYRLADDRLMQINQSIRQSAKASPEQMKIDRLEKEIKNLKAALKAKNNAKFEDLGGPEWNNTKTEAWNKLEEGRKAQQEAIKRIRRRAKGHGSLRDKVEQWLRDHQFY